MSDFGSVLAKTGFSLVPGERAVVAEEFSPALLTPWVKAKVLFTSERMLVEWPNSVLGLFATNKDQIAIPVNSMASVEVSNHFSVLNLLKGLGIFVAGVVMVVESSGVSLVAALLGLYLFMNASTSVLTVFNNAGTASTFKVSLLDRSRLQAFKSVIDAQLFTEKHNAQLSPSSQYDPNLESPVLAYSVIAEDKDALICLNGHSLTAQQRFCGLCGARNAAAQDVAVAAAF